MPEEGKGNQVKHQRGTRTEIQRLQLAGTSSTVFAVNSILNFSKGRKFQFLFGFVDPFSRIHMLVGVTNVRQMSFFSRLNRLNIWKTFP